MNKVFLGIPTHDGFVNQGIVNAIFSGGPALAKTQIQSGSALTTNFNNLYAEALNQRRNGFTHFCMIHSDVWPRDPSWLKDMLAISAEYRATILSVVIPLKSIDGKTSTALEEDQPGTLLGFRARKLTLTECKDLGGTFGGDRLLLNTGLMLIDLRHSEADKLWFEFQDSIAQDPEGNYYPVSLSEDYGLSRKARSLGMRLFVTLDVPAWHVGGGKFPNF